MNLGAHIFFTSNLGLIYYLGSHIFFTSNLGLIYFLVSPIFFPSRFHKLSRFSYLNFKPKFNLLSRFSYLLHFKPKFNLLYRFVYLYNLKPRFNLLSRFSYLSLVYHRGSHNFRSWIACIIYSWLPTKDKTVKKTQNSKNMMLWSVILVFCI